MTTKLLGALALCGAVFAATAEDCVSQTVGYTTIAVEGGKWYMAGTQFKDIGSATDEASINGVIQFKGVTPGTLADKESNAPEIQVYDGEGYVHYYYVSDALVSKTETTTAWVEKKQPVTTKIPLGKGFWIHIPEGITTPGATMGIKGEVKDATEATVNVGDSEWQIIANPLPVPVTFENLVTELTPGTLADKETNAPEIQVYDGEGYIHYYYVSDAMVSKTETKTAWVEKKQPVTGQFLDVGGSCWLKTSSKGSLTFKLSDK